MAAAAGNQLASCNKNSGKSTQQKEKVNVNVNVLARCNVEMLQRKQRQRQKGKKGKKQQNIHCQVESRGGEGDVQGSAAAWQDKKVYLPV